MVGVVAGLLAAIPVSSSSAFPLLGGSRLTENRSGTTTSSSFNNADPLTAKGSTAYTYDLDGQETAAGSRSCVWNVANQTLSSTLSGTTIAYSFDGDNARASSVVGATTTKYLWDKSFGLPQLALERDGSNSLLRRWITGLDTVSIATPSASYYLHHDYVGSVVNVTNATGTTQSTPLTGLREAGSRNGRRVGVEVLNATAAVPTGLLGAEPPRPHSQDASGVEPSLRETQLGRANAP